MALKHTYTLIAPFYDLLLQKATASIRKNSLQQINFKHKKTLIIGIGSGLDIPYLPKNEDITGIDITPAMLARAEKRAKQHHTRINLKVGDAMALDFDENQFDIVIMHLILAVVPHSEKAILEAERVLKNEGTLIIIDKFLKPGEFAPIKRAINLVLRHIATKTNVVIEPLLQKTPSLELTSDQPVLANGWFRRITCKKKV